MIAAALCRPLLGVSYGISLCLALWPVFRRTCISSVVIPEQLKLSDRQLIRGITIRPTLFCYLYNLDHVVPLSLLQQQRHNSARYAKITQYPLDCRKATHGSRAGGSSQPSRNKYRVPLCQAKIDGNKGRSNTSGDVMLIIFVTVFEHTTADALALIEESSPLISNGLYP